VVDSSGSIRENSRPGVDSWQLQVDFVKSIVGYFIVGVDATRFALVFFGMLLICDDVQIWCNSSIQSGKAQIAAAAVLNFQVM